MLAPEEWAEIVRPYANAGEDRRPTLDLPRSVPFDDDDTPMRSKVERQAGWLATTPIPKLHIAGLFGIAVYGPMSAAMGIFEVSTRSMSG